MIRYQIVNLHLLFCCSGHLLPDLHVSWSPSRFSALQLRPSGAKRRVFNTLMRICLQSAQQRTCLRFYGSAARGPSMVRPAPSLGTCRKVDSHHPFAELTAGPQKDESWAFTVGGVDLTEPATYRTPTKRQPPAGVGGHVMELPSLRFKVAPCRPWLQICAAVLLVAAAAQNKNHHNN